MADEMETTAGAVPCRLHVVMAQEADVAIVFRRGPSKWFHVLRWDLKSLELEPGAWLKGQLYPRRCGVSQDGNLLGTFALKGKWGAYFAVSKAPWMTALAAWKTGGTYTTGCLFGPKREFVMYGVYLGTEPFHGRYPFPVESGGMFMWRHGRYFNEYVRGWRALEEEAWMDRVKQLEEAGVQFFAQKEPPIILEQRSDKVKRTLGVCDSTDLLSTSSEPNREGIYYLTDRKDAPQILPDMRWADWDNERGRLLAATHSGALQVYDVTRKQQTLVWEKDLNGLTPEPTRSPEWAQSW